MPPPKWTTEDRLKLIRSFEARHRAPTAGALITWAALTVDSLNYLDEIDREYESNLPVESQWRGIIDVAHARWAAATAVTALDLCAAGLGRAICRHRGLRELDLEDFAPITRGKPEKIEERKLRRGQLPEPALDWIAAVRRDSRYKMIKRARDGLTHSYKGRRLSAGGPPQRLQLKLKEKEIGVREFIEGARDCATRHVSAFLQLLPQL